MILTNLDAEALLRNTPIPDVSNLVSTTDSRLSDSRPASDVYAWAKASVKPTYTYSEVGAAAVDHTHDSLYSPLGHVHDYASTTHDHDASYSPLGHTHSYQEPLVSGTNIKTVNGSSLLGSGNLVVSGSSSVTQVEVDFGSTPVTDKEFTITDAGVLSTNNVIVTPAYVDTTNNTADEIVASSIMCAAGYVMDGSFTVNVYSIDSTIRGKIKLNYIIG